MAGAASRGFYLEPRFELITDPPDKDKDVETPSQTVLRAPSIPQSDLPWIPPAPEAATANPIPAMDTAMPDAQGGEPDPVQPSGSQPKPKAKKKGTAAAVKKSPKKAKPKGSKPGPKSKKDALAMAEAAGPVSGATTEEESDNGPYCVCRGPDDHRWMICCEACEDWFHGECVHLDKEVGETLIEKFICPNCTDGRHYVTRYKKTCSLAGCIKPARIYDTEDKDKSVFCSDEHAQMWWDQMVSKLPTKHGKKPVKASDDSLTREELMAVLNSNLGGVDEANGQWRLAKQPFVPGSGKRPSTDAPQDTKAHEDPPGFLRDEEKQLLQASAKDRLMLGEEILQCKKMIQLLDWTHARLKAAIAAGRLPHDACGYDSRLDSVGVQADFRVFHESDEGKRIFESQKLGDPTGADDEDSMVRGMCEKKRCKQHAGWYHMFIRSTRAQIQELTVTAQEKLDQEKVIKEAAEERYYRLIAENNSVTVVNSGDEEEKPPVDDEMATGARPGGA